MRVDEAEHFEEELPSVGNDALGDVLHRLHVFSVNQYNYYE